MSSILVWSHQLLRNTRKQSALAGALEVAYSAAATILLAIAIYAMMSLPPGSEILQSVGADVSVWMMRYSLVLSTIVFVGNLWLSGQRRGEFGAYRYFPTSLHALSIALQFSRAFRIRYLALYAIVVALYVCALNDLAIAHMIMGVLTILVLDALGTMVVIIIHRNQTLFLGLGVGTSVSIVFDIISGNTISKYIYDMYTTFKIDHVVVIGLICMVVFIIEVCTVYLINDELRYGS